MLLRPYLIKLVSRNQLAQHEAENARAEEEAARKAAAKMSPNDLRGGPRVEVPEDTDSEGEGGDDAADASGPSWGKKARRRQRAMIRKLLEAEEKRLRETKEEEEDKDIEEFLIKE
jgi:phage-related minor tail protein